LLSPKFFKIYCTWNFEYSLSSPGISAGDFINDDFTTWWSSIQLNFFSFRNLLKWFYFAEMWFWHLVIYVNLLLANFLFHCILSKRLPLHYLGSIGSFCRYWDDNCKSWFQMKNYSWGYHEMKESKILLTKIEVCLLQQFHFLSLQKPQSLLEEMIRAKTFL